MSITLSHATGSISLPADLIWSDEYRWSPVAQQENITLDGSLVVQAMAQQSGRPITLTGGDDYAWIRRDTLAALVALAAQPLAALSLTLADGAPRAVIFTGERITAAPAWPIADPDAAQPYTLSLYFREI